MNPVVAELLTVTHRRWQAAGGERAALPAAAEHALAACRPWERLTGGGLLDELAGGAMLPDQPSRGQGAWGDPKVVLAREGGIEVIAYFMRYPRFDPHSHGFVGAFTLLNGLSVHAPRSFHTDQPESSPVIRGDVDQRPFELLRPGDIRPILDGFGLCHVVAHVAYPTVSLVISGNPRPGDSKMRTIVDTGVSAWTEDYLSDRGSLDVKLIEHLYTAEDDPAARVAPMVRAADDLHAYWYTWTAALLGAGRGAAAAWLEGHDEAWTAPLLEGLGTPVHRLARWSSIRSTADRLLVIGALVGVPPRQLLAWMAGIDGADGSASDAASRIMRLAAAGHLAFTLDGAGEVALEALIGGRGPTEAADFVRGGFDVPSGVDVEADVARFLDQVRDNRLLSALVAPR